MHTWNHKKLKKFSNFTILLFRNLLLKHKEFVAEKQLPSVL